MLKKLKLATKISILAGIVVIIGMFIASFLILNNIKTNSYNKAVNLSEEVSKGYANKISGELNEAYATANGIYNSILFAQQTGTLSREKVIDMLKTTLKKTPSVLGVYTLWEPNKFDGKDSEYVNKEGYDSTGRFIPYIVRDGNQIELTPLTGYTTEGTGDYYLIPKKTKKATLIEPFKYKIDGKEVLLTSIIIPVLDNSGNFMGIVGADVALSTMQEEVNKAKPMNGFALVVTNKGQIVAHGSDKSLISKNITNIDKTQGDTVKKIANGKEFMQSALVSNVKSLKVYEPITSNWTNTHWSFVSVISYDNVNSQYNALLKIIFLVFVVVTLIILIILYMLIIRSIKPVVYISDHLKLLADADFTKNIPDKYLVMGDEVGVLAKSVDTMQKSIKDIVANVKNEAENMNNSVENTSNALNTLNEQIENVSATTEQLSAGMEETAASSEEMNAASLQIEEVVCTIAEKASESLNSINEINTRASELKSNSIASNKNANEMYAVANQKLKVALKQSKSVDKINNLLEAILEISSQTNLLALNAAIEAAKAGEAGKGFAVVADEIRNLSEESNNAANEIKDVTKLVMDAVNNLSESSEEMLEFIDKQIIKEYEKLVQTGEKYSDDAKFMNSLISNFSNTSEELRVSIKDVINAVNGVAISANDGAKGTTDIAQKSLVIAKKADEVLKQTKNVKESSNNLNQLVSKIKI